MYVTHVPDLTARRNPVLCRTSVGTVAGRCRVVGEAAPADDAATEAPEGWSDLDSNICAQVEAG
jgi:hypothetical protein